MNQEKVTWKERISYGLGDMASSFTFMAINLYLMYFYTDVVGIAPAALATLFLILRLWDGVNDPIMGILVDKTKTKWGKSRPYFLWAAVPYGIITVLLFTNPGFTMAGKIIWAYVTYILYDLVYTVINLPLSSILASMTSDSQERTKLNATRMFLGRLGGAIITLGMLPLVALLGRGNESNGFMFTMIIFGVLGTITFFATFANTRERVVIPGEDFKIRDGLKAAVKNGPWWILLAVNFISWIGMSMQQATMLYYFKYVVGNPALAPAFMGISLFSTLIGISVAPLVTKRVGKRNAFIIGNVISIVGITGMLLFGGAVLPLLFVFAILCYFGTGFGTPLIFSMIADTVDYGEYLTGTRAQGILYSASSFGVKCGMGVGTGLCAVVLSMGNYVANVEQTASSVFAMKLNFLVIPLISMIVITGLLIFYKLDKKHKEVKEELEKRRGFVVDEEVFESVT